MKRGVQIVLMVVCLVPLLSPAGDETMAERKQRIMRKYLRERSNISLSELEVPFVDPDADELADSEQFKETQVELQRHEGGSPLPPPPPRPLRQTVNSNWLLDVDPLDAADSEEAEKSQQDRSGWGAQRRSGYDRLDQADQSPYSLGYGSRQEEAGGLREYKSFSFGNDTSGFQRQGTVVGEGAPRIFGQRPQEGSDGSGLGGLNTPRDRTYNSTLNQGRLQSPFQRQPTPFATDRSVFGSGNTGAGYTPYKSPYETRRQQQQQQTWGQQNQPRQEYKPQNPYQNWKDRSADRYDPTADDAFINELMPKTRR